MPPSPKLGLEPVVADLVHVQGAERAVAFVGLERPTQPASGENSG